MTRETRILDDQPGRSEPPERNEDLASALETEPWRSRKVTAIERVESPVRGWKLTYDA